MAEHTRQDYGRSPHGDVRAVNRVMAASCWYGQGMSRAQIGALTLLVDENVAAVRAAVEGVEEGDEVCALCLYTTPLEVLEDERARMGEPEAGPQAVVSVGMVSLETTQNRNRRLAATSVGELTFEAWNGEVFSTDYLPVADGIRTALFRESERLFARLAAEGAIPDEAVFNKVAYELTVKPPVRHPSTDFLAFLADEGSGSARAKDLWAAAPPSVSDLLVRKGLLPQEPSKAS